MVAKDKTHYGLYKTQYKLLNDNMKDELNVVKDDAWLDIWHKRLLILVRKRCRY